MIEKGRVISLISSAAGLLLTVGSMTVFSACGPKEDGTLMICHNAQIRVAMCGSKKQSDQTDLRYRGTCAFCGHIYDAGSTCTHMPAQQYALSGQA